MHSMAELRPGLSREQRGQAEAARQQLVLDLEQQVSFARLSETDVVG